MLKVGLRGNGGLFVSFPQQSPAEPAPLCGGTLRLIIYFYSMNDSPLNTSYWDDLYQHQQTNWDIGYVSTPLKEYFDQLTNKDLAILIPGCGNSYEAEYLLQQGFTNVMLVDISPLLTEKLAAKFSGYLDHQLHIMTSDFFELEGQYDLIIEQTFFCALPPSRRKDYVQKMYDLLKP